MSTLELTLACSLLVVVINAISGTLIAWVLVRDKFVGKSLVNSIIDMPFALPTIVAGLTLLALYGPLGPTGINIAYTRTAVMVALLFVTLPFVVRAVQPVLLGARRAMEEAARSLGAGGFTTFRRIILPNLLPAILSGSALGFARAVGEFGSVVLISGNIPFETQVASVHIFSRSRTTTPTGAAAVSVVLLALSLARPARDDLLDAARRRHRHARYRPPLRRAGVPRRPAGWPVGLRLLPDVRARLGPVLGRRDEPVRRARAQDDADLAAIAVPANTVFGILCALWHRAHAWQGRAQGRRSTRSSTCRSRSRRSSSACR